MCFLYKHKHLLTVEFCRTFLEMQEKRYAAATRKLSVLQNCIGFLDGTVLDIARPNSNAEENVASNGHKRKQALKYQTLSASDGLILHTHGALVESRHDSALHVQCGMNRKLKTELHIDDVQLCVHGDRGYNQRVTLDVLF